MGMMTELDTRGKTMSGDGTNGLCKNVLQSNGIDILKSHAPTQAPFAKQRCPITNSLNGMGDF